MTASTRLALLVNADGERWVTTFEEGHAPKALIRYGRAYTTIMTMDQRHGEWATRWACVPNGAATLSVVPNVARW